MNSDRLDVLAMWERFRRACMMEQPVDRAQIANAMYEWVRLRGVPALFPPRIVFMESRDDLTLDRFAPSALRQFASLGLGSMMAPIFHDFPRASPPFDLPGRARSPWAMLSGMGVAEHLQHRFHYGLAHLSYPNCQFLDMGTAVGSIFLESPFPLPFHQYFGASGISSRITPNGADNALLAAFEAGAWLCGVAGDHLFIMERPDCHLDDRGRLHSENSPAFVWKDVSEYRWHNVSVPDFVIEHPETITVQHIEAERNVEVRRVLMERYGYERYMRDSGASLIASDRFGTLFRKDVPNDIPIVMLQVTNSTPEPDGTFKRYMLRVDPGAYGGAAGRIPQAAAAWTFGIREWQEYAPAQET